MRVLTIRGSFRVSVWRINKATHRSTRKSCQVITVLVIRRQASECF